MARAHPLCGQLHLTSTRISAHFAEYFCPVHSPKISAPLPMWYKIKTKNQIVESQSTQVRQQVMVCDTQFFYGTSGPIVSEDGRCRASDSCALQGYVQMCMRSTLCSGDRRTTGIPTKIAENKQTNLGSYSIPTSCDHTISRQQSNLRLTHFQCSQYVWSKNQGRVTSNNAADSVTFAERVQETTSLDHRKKVHRSREHCSQIQQRVAPS